MEVLMKTNMLESHIHQKSFQLRNANRIAYKPDNPKLMYCTSNVWGFKNVQNLLFEKCLDNLRENKTHWNAKFLITTAKAFGEKSQILYYERIV